MITTGDAADTGEMFIGDYRMLALIGEGGMGVVHLAQAPDGRRVAMKVLRPHIIGDADARDRLAREVRSLQRVRSTRVAEFLDADPHGDVPFVVTRYVPGLPLHAHIEQHGPMDEPDLRHFSLGLAKALADVHSAGVLHRDIKPANVLLEGRAPVLIDFGLARVAEDARLTQTGWLLGTPGYLAAEVLYGDAPTAASDVHAWAGTVVFAATARPPYGKGPSMAVLDRVRRGEADLTGVPRSLTTLLGAALSPDPLVRPTVPEIIAALDPEAVSIARQPDPAEPTVPLVLADPTTRLLPVERPEVARPALDIAPEPLEPRRGRHRLGLLGIGLASTALVALAPYAGAVILAVLAALLRMASVTRQRHQRRRELRGRTRWFDVPASTLATPGYLVLSLGGTLVLWLWAIATSIAAAGVLLLARPGLVPGLLIVGAVFVLCLWWGPASARVREIGRGLTRPMAGESAAGPIVFGFGLLAAISLLAVLIGHGTIWAPAVDAPWQHGVLKQIVDNF